MMAVANIASILEYGKEGGVLKRIAGSGPRENGGKGPDADTKVLSKRGDGMHGRTESVLKKMEVDEPEEMHEDEMHEYDRFSDDHDASQPSDEAPQAFQRSVQLVFAILSHTMRHPVRKPTPWARWEFVDETYLSLHMRNCQQDVRSEALSSKARIIIRLPRE